MTAIWPFQTRGAGIERARGLLESIMQTTRNRRSSIVGCLVIGVLWGVTGTAEAGKFYIGVTGTGERLDVLYEKIVDNTDSRNISSNQGKIYRADDSAAKAAYGFGVLAGYHLPLGPSGVYLSSEIDMDYDGSVVRGHLRGAGTSEGRNQLGENWPEDWSFEKARSYGLTVRLGAGIPILGFGPSVYALAGLRRLKARFRSDYTGCLDPTPCTAPSEFVSGMDSFNENFNGWTTGGGLEKKLGNAAIRGELRYTGYGRAGRVIPFDDVAVKVPLALEADKVSVRVALVWYF